MTAFTNAGRDLIAAKQGASQVLTLDRFVLANIAGLDHTAAVNLNEALPQAGDIVWQGAVSASGYVNPDQVVYSLLLGSNVGDFTFNWVGLQADDDTLVAVAYVPPQQKIATNGTATGNNLTRNFLLAFTDAQTTTNITVAADTWQIDFNARLDGIDERERLANLDLYGRQRFLNDGWQLLENTGSYSLKAGDGFVAGYRVSQASDLALGDPGALPKDIWLDVALAGDITGKVISVTPVIASAAQSDYTDGASINHYLEKIGTINANGTVTDLRTTITAAGALVDEFMAHAVQATETTAGIAEVATQGETDAGTDDTHMVTPKKLDARVMGLGKSSVDVTGQDLNAIVKTGFYNGSSLINSPYSAPGYWFFVKVQSHNLNDKYVTQQAFDFHTDNMFFRRSVDSGGVRTWSPWRRVVKNMELAGSVAAFAMATPPSGWLECNGAAISRIAYAELFALIGTSYGVGDGSTTFNIPDLRGEFVRGFDNGRGVDSGRGIGTAQTDDFKSHVHAPPLANPTNEFVTRYDQNGVGALANITTGGGNFSSTPGTAPTGGAETRPRNVAMMYCIRY